jgi:hypothetical protein
MFVLDDIGECRNHLSFEVHAGTRMSGWSHWISERVCWVLIMSAAYIII